jgi:hypothetical protein
VKRLLAAVALAGAALALPGGAIAEPLAAVALAPDPLASTLVGPSGQVWQPDGKGGWTRGGPGGVAADVGGAVVATQLVVVGKATPAYRLDPDGWRALRLGERGKTVMGVGPHPAFAIGRNVFVWKAKAWVRVGDRAGGRRRAVGQPATASSTSPAPIVVWRLAGKAARRARGREPSRGFATGVGAGAWAVTADGALYDVAAKAAAPVTLAGERLAPVVADHRARRHRLGVRAARDRAGCWRGASAAPGRRSPRRPSPTTIGRWRWPSTPTARCSCRWPAARCGSRAPAPGPRPR